MSETYQSKQSFWAKIKNSAKNTIRVNAPKMKAAAKSAAKKGVEGARWGASKAWESYKAGQKSRPKAPKRRKSSPRGGKRRRRKS